MPSPSKPGSSDIEKEPAVMNDRNGTSSAMGPDRSGPFCAGTSGAGRPLDYAIGRTSAVRMIERQLDLRIQLRSCFGKTAQEIRG